MPKSIEIRPVAGPLDAVVRPPGSKSITNRALVCAALADGTSTLEGALESEDTLVMAEALRRLGIPVEQQASRFVVSGQGGRLAPGPLELYVANSGTTVRFLTPMVALGHGTYTLDGTPRMRERPIADLLTALAGLGVRAESTRGTGCPPVAVHAAGLAGGKATVRGDVSSQFLSGLLLAGPKAASDLVLTVDGPLVSEPYIRMTLAVMRSFGAAVEENDLRTFRIAAPRPYRALRYEIEPDASAASYFWAAAAIAGGSVKVAGLTRDSLQGDVRFCECLAQMGCRVAYEPDGVRVEGGPLVGVDVDMNDISDTVQTLSVVALFAKGPTTIRGVAHIRHKETDRISALAAELRRLGATVEEREDGLQIEGAGNELQRLHGAALDTYDDHRMAMSLALAGLKIPGVVINHPDCTAKTYPGFFADLDRVTTGASRG